MNTRNYKFKIPIRAACIGAALMVGSLSAYAADLGDQSIFELGPGASCDESGLTNILGDNNCGGVTGPDWADIFNASGGVVANFGGSARFIQDQVGTSADFTTYTSQGSDTNSQIVTDWTWTTNSVPPKDDITNAYAYTKTVNGHKIIYVGAEREVPNGDAHIDFEFYQQAIGLDHTPPCPAQTVCKFTGTNTSIGDLGSGKPGDLLISMDFTNGGAFAGLSIRERHEGAKSEQVNTVLGKITTGDNYDLIAVVPSGCNLVDIGTGLNRVCAFSNNGAIDGGPWPNIDSHGNEIFTLPTNAFTEWGIDVTALGLGTPCFPNILVKTRSSQSITAQLKDFALRSFEECNAGVTTEIRNSSNVDIQGQPVVGGTAVHDRAIVTGIADPTPTGTVEFSRFDNSTCNAPAASLESLVSLTTTANSATQTADSTPYTTVKGVSISYKAHYSGDGNYPAADGPCESLIVSELSSNVTTTIRKDDANGAIVLNTAVDISGGNVVNVVDVATVTATSGTAALGASGCSSPSEGALGTVTFTRHTSADCSDTSPVKETVCVGTTNINLGGVAEASAHTSQYLLSDPKGKFLCYQAKYSGNAAYDASAASGKEPLCAFPKVQ